MQVKFRKLNPQKAALNFVSAARKYETKETKNLEFTRFCKYRVRFAFEKNAAQRLASISQSRRCTRNKNCSGSQLRQPSVQTSKVALAETGADKKCTRPSAGISSLPTRRPNPFSALFLSFDDLAATNHVAGSEKAGENKSDDLSASGQVHYILGAARGPAPEFCYQVGANVLLSALQGAVSASLA